MLIIPPIIRAELVARKYTETEEIKTVKGVKYYGAMTKPKNGRKVWLGFDFCQQRYQELPD